MYYVLRITYKAFSRAKVGLLAWVRRQSGGVSGARQWYKAAALGVAAAMLLQAGMVTAQLEPGSGPGQSGSQMYTLKQIYDRLFSGAESGVMSSFSEPEAGPGGTMQSLDDIMALVPALDDTDGATADEVAEGKTFWGLRSGGWGLLIGLGGSGIELAATGQTTSYGDRDDGELQKGATADPRFSDNTDGTVTDNLTGLIWLENANCFGQRVWSDALSDANGLASGSCGLSDGSVAGDWRLPNRRELMSLVDYGASSSPRIPAVNPFDAVQSSYYWSSSTYAPNTASAWRVTFNAGFVNASLKSLDYYVWPVRSQE